MSTCNQALCIAYLRAVHWQIYAGRNPFRHLEIVDRSRSTTSSPLDIHPTVKDGPPTVGSAPGTPAWNLSRCKHYTPTRAILFVVESQARHTYTASSRFTVSDRDHGRPASNPCRRKSAPHAKQCTGQRTFCVMGFCLRQKGRRPPDRMRRQSNKVANDSTPSQQAYL